MTTHSRPLNIVSESIAKGRGIWHKDGPSTVMIRGDGKKQYCCGYCQAILISGTPSRDLGNVVLRCNECGTCNDFIRKPLFKKRPILLKDTMSGELKKPIHRFKTGILTPQHPHNAKLNSLSDKILFSFMQHQNNMPAVLQHYTSYHGLIGILASNSLWGTDISYMNDTSELKYGKGIIEEYLEVKATNATPTTKELLKRSRIYVDTDVTYEGFYACSFCTNGDLLSQWRAYGGGGSGYALGISLGHVPVTQKLHVRKVIYDKKLQEELIKSTIDDTLELFNVVSADKTVEDLIQDDTLPAFAHFLSSHLTEYIFTFKHPAFDEENEVRIIYDFNREEDIDHLKFRNFNSIPVPYLDLTLGSEDPRLPILPLVTVTHGPTHHPELVKKSLSLLLEKHKYQHVEIIGSQTPMRV